MIPTAQIEFAKRKGTVEAINLVVGNVSLPMHPAMIHRLANLRAGGSPFRNGAVRYTPTVGMPSGLCFPFGLGIHTRRTELHRYCFSLSSFASSSNHRPSPYSAIP